MKWLVRIAASIAAVIALLAAAGWMLPANHVASRSAEFAKPQAEVYSLVADVRGYPQWWSDVMRVEVLEEAPNRTTFREHLADGPIVMTVREAVPPTRFVTFIDDPDQPFGGSWTFEITSTPSGGSRLTITERGEIYNPIFRALARFVFGYTSTMESFLSAAAAKLR
jgi:ribosome-associated toxin RatA of RatAB toxin-antitoxin module